MATQTCSVKRATMNSNTGQSSEPTVVTGLTGLSCTARLPLDPRAFERARAKEFGANVSLWLVYVFGDYDIRDGDLMTISNDNREYPVREAIPWRHGRVFVECVVEEVQGTVVAGEWQR